MSHAQMRRIKLTRSSEYMNLRHVVPSLRRQRDVGKIEVVTEAARYIDHLHKTLIERFVLCGIPDSLKDVLGTDDASQLGSQHIMNLVASMAAAQRQQEQSQQMARRQQQLRRNPHLYQQQQQQQKQRQHNHRMQQISARLQAQRARVGRTHLSKKCPQAPIQQQQQRQQQETSLAALRQRSRALSMSAIYRRRRTATPVQRAPAAAATRHETITTPVGRRNSESDSVEDPKEFKRC